jgi:riboflavin kinase
MKIKGEVFTGLGEGADYIGMKPYQEKIQSITGFYPYAGTLNLRVQPEKLQELKQNNEPHVIESFEYEGSDLSRVEVYTVEVEGVEAAYLDIEITDHGDDVMEIVAEDYLRDKLDLEDGDTVEVTTQ